MQAHKRLFIKQALLWLLACALIWAIYVLSGQEGAASHRLSRGVVKEAVTIIELPEILKHYIVKLEMNYELVLRKIAHFSLFFILAILLYFAIKSHRKKHAKILTIICCIFFAGMDEYHQIFIAGRNARFTDIIIDIAGAVCALLLVTAYARHMDGNGKTRENTILKN
jgi:VanZ family protein